MGNGLTKEEQVYQAVQNGNHNAVKALRREGASLEWVDKEGRTPLILACTRGDRLDMVSTLLTLGANLRAYRPGTHGGMPLHHAAKRGLDKTVRVLLDNGADPLAVNDDSLTPLDMARNRGHTSVVRLIEDRICFFCGMVRELSGFALLEALAPQWVTKKIWVVVLPVELDPRRPPRFELVIYQSPKVPLPRTIISLAKAEVEEPKFSLADPVLVITDKTKSKHKFLSEQEGDKEQLERLYKACRGFSQVKTLTRPMTQQQQYPPTSSQEPSASSTSTHQGLGPSPGKLQMQMELPDDVALKMAIDASLRTATEEGLQLSAAGELTNVQDRRHGESSDSRTRMSPPENAAAKFGGWAADEKQQSGYNGWSSSNEEAGPSRVQDFPGKQSKHPDSESKVKPEDSPVAEVTASDVLLPAPETTSTSLPSPPSAPPLPADFAALENSDNVGAIHYPPVDTSPAQVDLAAVAPSNEKVAAAAATTSSQDGANQCVVCWDAPAQGVCIPCGHLAGCMSCLSEIKAKNWGCPVCRAPIEQVIRVYAV
ncbi:unnamed protein product [Sphagnum troendelagicum]|uniref:RING-type domain-containing protein n=1 Tax=Sphagnum troendelagicum TaxID=128251 RepID=A0ABP0UBG4_9BRYO